MVEGIPGPDFAGVKTPWRKVIFTDIKAWGRLRCRVAPGPLCVSCVCIARCFIVRVVLLFVAHFYVLKMRCGDFLGIFLMNSAEKCDLTRGVVLFSDHMCCYCVPVHGNCGF